jgi:membrane protease YdiL (CAAX protease family)
MAEKYDEKNEIRRTLVVLILSFIIVGFVLINVQFNAGIIYAILAFFSLIIIILWKYIKAIFSISPQEDTLFGVEKHWIKGGFIGMFVSGGFFFLSKVAPAISMSLPYVPLSFLAQGIIVILCAPVVESIFFLTCLLSLLAMIFRRWFSDTTAFWIAAIIQAVAFAFYHVFAYAGVLSLASIISVSGAMIAAGIFGIASAVLVRIKNWGGLACVITAHALINTFLLMSLAVVV